MSPNKFYNDNLKNDLLLWFSKLNMWQNYTISDEEKIFKNSENRSSFKI